ncbi:MAG: LuxR C-terminal-related transcriptional regulator [Actinoplanes sp.]
MTGLVGRSVELAHLTRTIDARGTLLITGSRGSGRSRLLAAGIQLARRRGPYRIVVVHTGPAARPTFRQMLLSVRHEMPELLSPYRRDARSVVEAFAQVNRHTPTLVVADDVDRVPPEVAAVLADLPGAVLLAGTRVPAPLADRPALELAPLTDRDAVRLLDARADRPAGRDRVEILRRAAGNPAALIEIGRGGPLQASFAAQIAALPDPSRRRLLHLAAASPCPAPADETWKTEEQAGLVVRLDGSIRFTHPLAADAAYRSATAHQRHEAHRELAATPDSHAPHPTAGPGRHALPLASEPEHRGPEPSAEPDRRALHLAAISDERDEALAAELEITSDAFRARGELFEATDALRQAAERSPLPRDAARRFARAAADAGLLGAAEWAVELHSAVRDRTDDPGLIAPATAAAARALSRSGRQHEAYELITAVRGIDAAAVIEPATAITLISGREEYRRWLAAALAEAGPALDPMLATFARLVVDPAAHHGRALCDAITPPPAGTALTTEDRFRLTLAGSIATFEDRTRLAADLLLAAMEPTAPAPTLVSAPAGSVPPRPGAPVETVPVLVGALIDTGQWDLAERHSAGLTLEGMPVAAAHLDALRAHLLALRGDTSTASALVRKAWTRLDIEQHRAIHVRLLRAAGLAALAGGDYDDAYRHLRSMFDRDGRPLQILAGRGIAELSAAAARSNHHEDVRPILAHVRAGAGAEPSTRMRLLLHVADGLLTDGDQAEHHYRQATADPAGHQWPYEQAMARLLYGEWLRRARRPRDARTVLSTAAEVFAALGARPAAALAARELEASGHSSEPVTGTQLSRLTPQERQVARLAARGLPDREIAARLVISVRTVGSHLHSIYPKLGINSRHQLAEAFAER